MNAPWNAPISDRFSSLCARDPPEDGVFFRVFYRNLALLHLHFLLVPFIVLLQNILLHLLRMVKI